MYDVPMKQHFFVLLLVAQGLRLAANTGRHLEGVGGVNNADERLLPGQRRYEESRRLLTGEVTRERAASPGQYAAL